MNNKNKILVGCLALLLVLSVGYALFSETITINGTAKAKGDFNITATVIEYSSIYGDEGTGERGIVTDSDISVNDNVITSSVTLGAPGSQKIFVVKVENTGSIPARLKSVTDEKGNELDVLYNGFGFIRECNQDETTCMIFEMIVDGNYGVDYEAEPWGEESISGIEDLNESVLDPGESTAYYFDYIWGENSTSQDEISLTSKIKLNWEQISN